MVKANELVQKLSETLTLSQRIGFCLTGLTGIGGVEGDPKEDEGRIWIALLVIGPPKPRDRAVHAKPHFFGEGIPARTLFCL